MKKVEVELEVITPMFSYGADTKEAEFRVTELKALMRTTFREVYKFDSIEDMKKKEGELFGDLEHKSPIRFKCKRYIGEDKECLLPRYGERESKQEICCLKPGIQFKIEFIINEKYLKDLWGKSGFEKEFDENFYFKLLILSSALGGLGKRARSGMGSFKINSIKNKDNKDILPDLLKDGVAFKDCKFKDNEEYPNLKNMYVYKFENDKNKLYIKLKGISELRHKKFYLSKGNYDKRIMGDGRKRYASPVYVTFYKEDKEYIYMIIKVLNYKCAPVDFINDFNNSYIEACINYLKEIGEKDEEIYFGDNNRSSTNYNRRIQKA